MEKNIRSQLDNADIAVKSMQEQLVAELNEARNEAQVSFKTEAARLKLQDTERLTKYQAEIDKIHGETYIQIDAKYAELVGIIDRSKTEVIKFENDCSSEIKKLTKALEQYNTDSKNLSQSNEENIALLKSKMDEANINIKAQSAEILSEIEEKVHLLNNSVNDSDTRIKDFFEQSKMIEKVDAMRKDLSRRIDDIAVDMDRLELHSTKITGIETQVNKVMRLEEELKAKMTQFSFEQTRIERMEDDFKRLLQTQVSVEEKLKSLTGADDALQDIQIKMRKLNDLMNETEEKFQRIEHKNQTLEETNSGIDRNFKTLQESEKTAQQFINDLQRVNIGLEDIRASIEKLTAENDKAKETSEKALELNNLLGDIELRITQMKKDQMWFANLETRIDEAKKDIHQSIKTIGVIQKKEGDRIQLDKDGGIPISVQEQVLILKKDGWTDKEIASSLKISIGAIQLIVDAKSREL